MAQQTGNLGNAYLSLGEYQKAINHCKKALEITTAIGDQLGMANASSNLGTTYLHSGEYKGASVYLVEAIRIFHKILFNFVPDRNKLSFISFLYVCMVNTIYLLSFVETPRKFIIAELSIRKLGSSSVLIIPALLALIPVLLALMKI